MRQSSWSSEFTDEFWAIIAKADMSDEKLSVVLEDLSKEQIRGFYSEFRLAATELKYDKFTDHLPDASEDALSDITEYVVSKGREFYDHIIEHPGEIPEIVDLTKIPAFKGTTLMLYRRRFGEKLKMKRQ